VYVLSSLSLAGSRFRSMTLRMEVSGVVCGEIGGKRDWKIVVVRDSRCLGILFATSVSEAGVVKLFMTSYRLLVLILDIWRKSIPEEETNIPFRHL